MEDKQSLVLRAEHAMKMESTLPWDLSGAGVSSLCEAAAKSLFIHSLTNWKRKEFQYLQVTHTHTQHAQKWMHFDAGRLNLQQKHYEKHLVCVCCSTENVGIGYPPPQPPFKEPLFPPFQLKLLELLQSPQEFPFITQIPLRQTTSHFYQCKALVKLKD